MSLSGISSSNFSEFNTQTAQSNRQQFQQDFQQLGQDLQSGNLSAAQTDFATIQQIRHRIRLPQVHRRRATVPSPRSSASFPRTSSPEISRLPSRPTRPFSRTSKTSKPAKPNRTIITITVEAEVERAPVHRALVARARVKVAPSASFSASSAPISKPAISPPLNRPTPRCSRTSSSMPPAAPAPRQDHRSPHQPAFP